MEKPDKGIQKIIGKRNKKPRKKSKIKGGRHRKNCIQKKRQMHGIIENKNCEEVQHKSKEAQKPGS